MALPNPDHPSVGTRRVPYGVPTTIHTGESLLRTAVASGESATLQHLARAVGGVDALERLHGDPWAPAPFDWSLVAAADRDLVASVLAVVADRTVRLIDHEYRDIIVRLVERAVSRCPALLRKGDDMRTAAALTWLAVCGNGAMQRTGRSPNATQVWATFGVRSCAVRGRALYDAMELRPADPTWSCPLDTRVAVWLCDERLLHSSTRARLVERRRWALEFVQKERARAPISAAPDGKVQLRARHFVPEWALRATLDTGRDFVVVTFDDDDERPFLIGMSVPDARHLVHLLSDALDGPSPLRR